VATLPTENVTTERVRASYRDAGLSGHYVDLVLNKDFTGNLGLLQVPGHPAVGFGPHHGLRQTVGTHLLQQFLNVVFELSLVHNSGMR